MDRYRWLLMLTTLLISEATLAEETAQRAGYMPEYKMEHRLLRALSLQENEVGIYYVEPPRAEAQGFVVDALPRETILTDAHFTEQRLKKEGKFVRFSHRQITYSLLETRDDSVRFNLYPNKKAVMLSWTHSIPVLAD